MFVGHAALAFALLAGAAAYAGLDRRRALALGAVGGIFATVPDVDMVYALVGLVRLGTFGLWTAVDAFWETGSVLHRTVTHSIVLGAPAAVGVALVTVPRWRLAGGALLASLVGWIALVGGMLAGLTTAVFLLVGAVVAVLARERLDLGPTDVFTAAAVGFISHPFGDLLTGEPPAVLYPLDVTVFPARIVLSEVPTLHLLGAFGVELATLWLAAMVLASLQGFAILPLIDRRALAGAGYGAAALVLPAPTLETSYHFVFSVAAIGAAGAVPRLSRRRPESHCSALLTGLTAVTVAAAAYAVAFLLA